MKNFTKYLIHIFKIKYNYLQFVISNKKIHYLYCPRLFGVNLSLWSTFSKNYLQQDGLILRE